jgi:plasminogen activator inhibitor 1 RNA-binding protein
MTLEEFEKIKEEKRKALLALKTEERKVEVDKDLQAMQLLSTKKGNDEVFIKLVILPVMPCTLFMFP